MENQNPTPANPMLVPLIIWAALLFSTFTYYMVLMQVPPPVEPNTLLVTPLSIAAGLCFAFSLFLPGILLKQSAKRAREPITLKSVLPIFMIPFVLRMALADSVAVFGFIIAQQAGANYYLPFWAASAFSIAIAFPTETGILGQIRKNL